MNEPLSIGMVCYPSLGGSGVVASDLATALARHGHAVHVIASARPSRLPSECAGLSFHEVSPSKHPLFDHPPLALAARITDVAIREQLDLVHVHYAVPHAASAYLARQALADAAPRFITTLHGTDVTRVDVDPIHRPITRLTVAASDGVTVPSEFLRREAYRLLDLPADLPIEVIANFVDTDRFAPPDSRDRHRFNELFSGDGNADTDGPVLFHVSNFRAVKRTADLIEVLLRVRQRVPARLILVGDGPERKQTEQRAEDLGIANAVCFLGNQADFVDYLKHADAFLLTSESESFGVAALEAMSAGVPVFAYRVGGLPEVVPERAGCLVEAFNIAALSQAVVAAIADPEQHAALGQAARAHVLARFQHAPAIERYETFYRKVLASPSRKDTE